MKLHFRTTLAILCLCAGVWQQASGQSCVTNAPGLTSWWRGENNAFDVLGGNQGMLTNVTYTNGKVADCFAFTGTNSAVIVGNAANLAVQAFTIEGWVQRSSTNIVSYDSQGNAQIFGGGSGGYALAIHSNGFLLITKIDHQEGDATVQIPADLNWHHIAVTATNTTATFYVDGTNSCTISDYPGGYTFGYDDAIGARSDNLHNSFYGQIDELSVYANVVLTSNQIGAIVSAGVGGKCVIDQFSPCASAPTDMVSWWKGESNIFDSWGTNQGLVLTNATYGAGEVGTAFAISGTNGAVLLGYSNSLAVTTFTIEGWIQRSSASFLSAAGNGHIFGYGSGGYAFALNAGPQVAGYPTNSLLFTKVGYSEVDSYAVVSDTAWHHVAVVMAPPTVAFYLDGVSNAASGTYTPGFFFTTEAAIGARADTDQSNSFCGKIDELSFYNRALSTAEISNIYAEGVAGKCGPVITQQPLSETAPYGTGAIFSVVAAQAPLPLSYQWQLNGTNVLSATNSFYTNYTATGTNTVSVIVTDGYSEVTSSSATLLVPGNNAANFRLSYWKFDNTSFTNQVGTGWTTSNNMSTNSSFSGTSASFTNNSVLVYNQTNFSCSNGTVRFWFQPNWTTGQSGAPAGGSFIQIGSGSQGFNGGAGWVFGVGQYGSNLTLNTWSGNDGVANQSGNLFFDNDAQTTFSNGFWYQIALTWSPTNVAAYTNGVLLATRTAGYVLWTGGTNTIPLYGPGGVLYYPTGSGLNTGISIGNTVGYGVSILGQLDEFETFNYPLTAQQIAGGFPTFGGVTNVMVDSDYTGRSDLLKINVDGITATNNPAQFVGCRLGYWRFDTNWFEGNYLFPEQGQMPAASFGVNLSNSWSGTALSVGGASQSSVTYPDVYTNGWANINCRNGTVRLWVKPNWSGGAPLSAPLIYLGNAMSPTNGEWCLQITNNGTKLELVTASNNTPTVNAWATCSLNSSKWTQIVLTYGSSGCALYINGALATSTSTGVANWPSLADRANGMVIGNTTAYATPANCQFDEIETFNYQLSGGAITNNYQTVAAVDSNMDGIPDVLEDMQYGSSQPYLGAPVIVTGTLKAEQFDQGSTNVSYYNLAGNPTNGYRGTAMFITNCYDTNGIDTGAVGYCLQGRATEWVNYSINVSVSQVYTLEARLAGVGTGGTFSFAIASSTNPTAITIPTNTWTNVSTHAYIPAGTTVVTLHFLSDGTNSGGGDSGYVAQFNYISIYPYVPSPTNGTYTVTAVPPWPNANSWGAAVSNAASIQTAINGVPSNGGTVYITNGTYYLSEASPDESTSSDTAVQVASTNVQITGTEMSGTNATILIAFDRVTTLFTFNTTNSVLSDLTMQAQPHQVAVTNTSSPYGFTNYSESGSYNFGLKTNHNGTLCAYGGATSNSPTMNILVSNCWFLNADRAILLSIASNCVIQNCNFIACQSNSLFTNLFSDIVQYPNNAYSTQGSNIQNDVCILASTVYNLAVISNAYNGNTTFTNATYPTTRMAPDGFLWGQQSGNIFVGRNVIANNFLEAVQLNGGPNGVAGNSFSTLLVSNSICAFKNSAKALGATGTTNDYFSTFVGNWIYGEYFGAADGEATNQSPHALNFSGNYFNFTNSVATNGFPGTAANIESNSAANICGNTLASGGNGLFYTDGCGTALVMMNNFSGATLGAIGCGGGTLPSSVPGMQTARIFRNILADPVTFDVQVASPFTNSFGWFLYQNQYINSASNSVPPFIDPTSSAVHLN